MKAITCPQCGALIQRISPGDKFAFCDYCEAKILLAENKENIVQISGRKVEFAPTNYLPPQTNYSVWIIMAVILLFGLPIILVFILAGKPSKSSNNSPVKTVSTRYTATPFPFPTVSSTVYPQINYQVSVKWDGDNDMEHFENPSIDSSKLTTDDEKVLKKTVFANRSVQVRVTINENGEVSEAKAISGHPILKEAAENAAKKTLFANRPKPAKRLLTYIFRLVTE